MLNKRQREFKKKMKEINRLKNQEYIHGSLAHNTYRGSKGKKPFFVLGGVVGGLVLTWNLYAAYTWFIPGTSHFPSIEALTGSHVEEEIHSYFVKAEEIESKLAYQVNYLTASAQHGPLDQETIQLVNQSLFLLSEQMVNGDERTSELEHYLNGQIDLIHQMLAVCSPTLDPEKLNTILTRYNQNLLNKSFILISILEKEEMHYLIEDDGISYEYEEKSLW
ncbi:hypothetical protein [Jeotgalibacillus campisalis]|uniref:Uncharacterized protein n=1 Tax=Jeotgalibacillus campisalis TaxID=220754 RepID=A0A0C2W4V2_9BACL|nr:hypothetical protein [Jeotgalibacillus campisalis]KIL51038.1 hypothetical protein KR50_09190 [Jeotgalibacillus campisalis]